MASINKRNGKWSVRVSFYDKFGKRHFKNKEGFNRKKEAEAWANEIEQGKFDESIGKTKSHATFSDYFLNWYQTFKAPILSEATKRRYLITYKEVKTYFGESKITGISRLQYQEFLNEYGKTHSIASSKKVNTQIKACVHDAMDDGAIQLDFTKKSKITGHAGKDSSMKFLDANDMTNLIKYLKLDINARHVTKMMGIVALYTGARFAEIAGLTWKDISPDFGTISINKAWNTLDNSGFKETKNEQSKRIIRANPELFALLDQYRDTQKFLHINNPLDLIFMGPNGKVPSSNAANNMLHTALKNINASKDITFHGLRHTHASYLIYKGVSIYYISQRLGHANYTITMNIYSHMLHEMESAENSKLVAALNDLNGAQRHIAERPVQRHL
ncbi:site-specific integrase [Levilactobacillus brevis]|uniref:site-specific integrase n=1 Tax=Levilactobacillus brevis TaxID=1580 RepID=UPI000BEAB9CE|nr:site-specific integrase [Levilactobacillus brevis]STX19316.1 prophage Lp2 protein 2, integrase [Levilactobacillus brevis]